MESISPNIFVKDMSQTMSFYAQLGFETIMTVPETGHQFVWAMMKCGEVTFMFQTFESLGDDMPEISRHTGGSLLLYINIKNIHDFYEKIKSNVTVLTDLNKTFYGATEFSICDNNGYVITFAEHE